MAIGENFGKTKQKSENTREWTGISMGLRCGNFVMSFKDRIVFKVPFLPRRRPGQKGD